MRNSGLCIASMLLSAALAPLAARSQSAASTDSRSIMGFTPAHTAVQRALESEFQAIPSADKAREWHRLFTLKPHPAASAENNRLASVIAREWRRQGWEDVTLRR